MPAPTFQAAGTLQGNTTNITVGWPTHQTNDIALLICEATGGQAIALNTAAGFVEVTNSPQSTGTTTAGTRVAVFWCRATSGAMTSPVVTNPGDHIEGIIVTFRGCVTSGNPWDVTAGGVKAGASASGSMTGLTTTADEVMVVCCATRDTDSAAAAFSAQANATLSQLVEQVDTGTIAGNGGGICVVTGVRNNAGVVAATTFTVSSSINAYLTIALDGDTTAPTAGPPNGPQPGSRVVLREQGSLNDASTWPTQWATSASGGKVNVRGGGLRMGLDGLTGGYAESGSAYLATVNNTSYVRLPATNWDFVVDFVVSNLTSENYIGISMADGNAGAGIANNGYTISLSPSTAAYAIQRRDAGVQNDIVSGAFTFVANTTHRFLWVRRGNFLGSKVWTPTGSPMPATWTASVSDARYRGPQYAIPLLGLLGGNVAGPSEVTFRNLMISVPHARRRGGRL